MGGPGLGECRPAPQVNEGKVLWLILHGCQNVARMDEPQAKLFLRTLAEKEIRMTLLPATCSFQFPKAGISACQLIAESHLGIHTWPETAGVSLLVYSCRKFRTDRVVKYVQRFFRPLVIDVREAERKYVLCRRGGAR